MKKRLRGFAIAHGQAHARLDSKLRFTWSSQGNGQVEKILTERKFALPRYFDYKWSVLEVWR